MEYKVVALKADEKLEADLNDLAGDGWVLKHVIPDDSPSNRQVFWVFFERSTDRSAG